MKELNHKITSVMPFQDMEACKRVRAIKKEDICKHSNPDFKIRVIKNEDFELRRILDMFIFIKEAADKEEQLVLILPNPHPEYRHVAYLINKFKVDCKKLWTFNMDEYVDEDGKVAPDDWPQGFNHCFLNSFYYQIDKKLRPLRNQAVGFTDKNIGDYGKMIEDLGGADICFGALGWTGHVAFIDPGSPEFAADSLEEFLEMGPRVVTLNPITIAQECLEPSGDWSSIPPKAVTIGPKEIMGAKLYQSWNGFHVAGTNISWERFVVRLAAHGPVTQHMPASILQLRRTDFFIKEVLAESV
jgi:6-phosphogluconolactonase/glucosamine-6-phosphate isomerase/deaminase